MLWMKPLNKPEMFRFAQHDSAIYDHIERTGRAGTLG